MKVEDDALALIARAAEGSVRDGLSLLDQALVQGKRGEPVKTEIVRDMLGLADRTQTISLFEQVMGGRTAEALQTFRTLYGYGADPVQVTNDLLEHCHAASVAKMLGPQATRLPADQAATLAALGASISAGTLSRVWQMLLKALDEVRRAPSPADAVEMALVRLAYAADLPGPEEALRALQNGEGPQGSNSGPGGGPGRGSPGGSGVSAGGVSSARMMVSQPVAAPAMPDPQSFEQVVALIGNKREIGLQMEVQRYVKLVSFKPGAIVYESSPEAPLDLARKLASRLKDWTGRTWLIAANGQGGGETLIEADRRRKLEERAVVEADPFVKAVMDAFPGARLDFRVIAPAVEMPVIPDELADEDD
jgi:DNA polymerase-3 subunit gamma/tau